MGSLIPLGFWAASKPSTPSGPADYELISTTILGSSAASVTFSGLGTSAAAYKHLQIRCAVRSDRVSGADFMELRFNGDSTAANYAQHGLEGNGSSVTSYATTSNGQITVGYLSSAIDSSSIYSATVIDILDFASTSKNKTVRSLTGVPATSINISLRSGAWFSTAAATSITLSSFYGVNFVTGSRFSLYGLK